MPTKADFLEAYGAQLASRWEDLCAKGAPDGLTFEVWRGRIMAAATETITTNRKPWVWRSPAVVAAWRAIGGKGQPSLQDLRDLA